MKTHTTINIDVKLKEEAKKKGICLSHAAEKGIKMAVGDIGEDQQILKMKEEREKIQQEIKQKKSKIDYLEEEAVEMVGTTIDDYIQNNQPKTLREKKIDDFLDSTTLEEKYKSGQVQDPEEVAHIYENKLKKLGARNRMQQIEFAKEVQEVIERKTNQEDIMVR